MQEPMIDGKISWMNQQKLYLFIGYPGAGKTTVAKVIAETTGAIHLWADVERHKNFPNPNHTKEESDQLYNKLNALTDKLLSEGKSVVFDTNFNFHDDRQKLRQIAQKYDAKTLVVWVNTPADVAKERAVYGHRSRNLYKLNMTDEQFESIASKLEEPTKDETVVKLDGTHLDPDAIKEALGI